MFRLSFWLNLAAIACLAWGLASGFQTHQREVARVRALMRGKFDACASRFYATPDRQEHRVQLLRMDCGESLDEERWAPVLAPNLARDTMMACALPTILALALAGLPLALPRARPARRPRPRASPRPGPAT